MTIKFAMPGTSVFRRKCLRMVFSLENGTTTFWIQKSNKVTHGELPEVFIIGKRSFRELHFSGLLSADRDYMKNFSANQLFQNWIDLISFEWALFWVEWFSALFQRNSNLCSTLIFLALKLGFSALNSLIQRWFSVKQLWRLNVWMRTSKYDNIIRKRWKRIKWTLKWPSNT